MTTGLLRVLSAAERRVLFAHEESHLAHRHSWWVLAADLAAGVNPLLEHAVRDVAFAAERWADEDAAALVGDRRLVARTVARAALHVRGSGLASGTALAAVGGRVPARVRALLEPQTQRRPVLPTAVLLGLLISSVVGALILQQRTDAMLDNAGNVPPLVGLEHTR